MPFAILYGVGDGWMVFGLLREYSTGYSTGRDEDVGGELCYNIIPITNHTVYI